MCMQSIVGWWHQRAGVAAEVAAMGPAIVAATVDIYQAIRKELLPTPAKSHYTYNMRDLSKVFQGISMVGVPVDTPEKMARWVPGNTQEAHPGVSLICLLSLMGPCMRFSLVWKCICQQAASFCFL